MLRPVGLLGYPQIGLAILRRMWRDVLTAFLLCLCSVKLAEELSEIFFPKVLLPMLGIAISVFTAFRNTQAYNRWWEARTLWGALVNQSRNWRDELITLLPQDAPSQAQMQSILERQVLLVWTLNHELRKAIHPHTLTAFREMQSSHGDLNSTSQTLLQEQALEIRDLYQEGKIDQFGRLALMEVQTQSCNAIGGLERISNQPLPATYDLMIRLSVWAFGYLLFVNLDAMSEPFGGLVGFMVMLGFITAERLGAYTEHPFVSRAFGLPMNRICATVTHSLLGANHPLATPPEGPNSSLWT